MKRVSLQQKIEVCQRYGTLKTYTLSEAIEHYNLVFSYSDEEMNEKRDGLIASYDEGKYLCGFISNNDCLDFDTVYQIGNLPFFVKELIYWMIEELGG